MPWNCADAKNALALSKKVILPFLLGLDRMTTVPVAGTLSYGITS